MHCFLSSLSLSLTFSPLHRYYTDTDNIAWPPQVQDYNKWFTKVLQAIKTQHDPTITTIAQGVLKWKQSCNAQHIRLDIQSWLDCFYMSRIRIQFLIGQRESGPSSQYPNLKESCLRCDIEYPTST